MFWGLFSKLCMCFNFTITSLKYIYVYSEKRCIIRSLYSLEIFQIHSTKCNTKKMVKWPILNGLHTELLDGSLL